MRYAALALLLVALFVGACSSGDDDDDGGSNDTTMTATSDDGSSTAEATSDNADSSDDGSTSSNDSEISGKEDEYAADLCTALDNFTNDLPGLLTGSALASGDLTKLAEPFRKLGEDLQAANPPDFMEEYHSRLVEYVFAQADAFETGDTTALDQLQDLGDIPEPSQAELEAFARSARNVEACGRVGLAPAQ